MEGYYKATPYCRKILDHYPIALINYTANQNTSGSADALRREARTLARRNLPNLNEFLTRLSYDGLDTVDNASLTLRVQLSGFRG